MQQVDLSQYRNSAEWYVQHDPSDNLYRITSPKGSYIGGKFSRRLNAEAFLATYLNKIEVAAVKQQTYKKERKDNLPNIKPMPEQDNKGLTEIVNP